MPIDDDTEFLGQRLSGLSLAGVIDKAVKWSRDRTFHYIVTPNVDHILKLTGPYANPAFQAAAAGADLRLCDSRILAGLAKLSGFRLRVVPGSDLTAALFKTILAKGDKVAIIGGREDTLPRLAKLFPGPEYCQHIPPMGMLANPQAMQAAEAFICDAKANYLFLAIGAPQAEILAHRCAKEAMATGVSLCIGASIDFLVGDQRRAPLWLQRIGLEWAYRLGSDPKRLWRRYLVEGPKIFMVYLRHRRTH
jgi:N-acetylglucosaminyldiphosphoundecaprenol N-acetyl-beta-D-mannosaminyltransferase